MSKFVIYLLILTIISFFLIDFIESKKKNSHIKATAADDAIHHSTPIIQKKSGKGKGNKKDNAHNDYVPSNPKSTHISNDDDFTIEDVDEDKIDDFIKEASKNLVIFFYDGKLKCPDCQDALKVIEEIDSAIEDTGYIEVVKTNDRTVAIEFGIQTYPAILYVRRHRNPVLCDIPIKDPETILRWIRAHDEVATWQLTDNNFENLVNAYQPNEGSLDWFVMFYNGDDVDDRAFIGLWETVAHKLRGLVHVGMVDTSTNDDVTERFRVDEHFTPCFLLFHRGKMYRYNDPAKDVRTLTLFALSKFKDQRGHRVPEPPTLIEQFYEQLKEFVLDAAEDSQKMTVLGVGSLIIACTISLIYKAHKIKSNQVIGNDDEKDKTQ
uniref:Thioredoxin domain-containing protein n=1 Tax=Parastrongyloides trichosuri TaxID=131310 RepID=A0A0N4ZNG9_PARTI